MLSSTKNIKKLEDKIAELDKKIDMALKSR